MAVLEDPVKMTMKEICAKHGIELSELRSGRRSGDYTLVRKAIARKLIAKHDLKYGEIGELTGVSGSAIWHLVNKKTTETKTPKPKKDSRAAKPEKDGQIITIDFSEHPETLIELEKYSKERIRSIEGQILFFIKELFEKKNKADGNQG